MTQTTDIQTDTQPASTSTSPSTPLSKQAKWIAGILLVGLTTLTVILVIAFWPDRLPDLSKNETSVYEYKLFNMRLLDTAELKACRTIQQNTDTSKTTGIDTSSNKQGDTTLVKDTTPKATQTAVAAYNLKPIDCSNTIHLNTLLLILVAFMGFLGNMIHVSTSFTTFIGNDSFKRSWLLWYCVKPFTAAGFAIILYFVLRGGFLSYNSGVANFNIYGILAMAALAGLFTDTATLKLKEVFDVIFKPKDDRGDKLNNLTQSSTTITTTTSDNSNNSNGNTTPAVAPVALAFNVVSVSPETLSKDAANNIVLAGTGLNKQGLTITVGSTTIDSYTPSDTSISFTYTANAADQANPTVPLLVLDAGTNLYATNLSFA